MSGGSGPTRRWVDINPRFRVAVAVLSFSLLLLVLSSSFLFFVVVLQWVVGITGVWHNWFLS